MFYADYRSDSGTLGFHPAAGQTLGRSQRQDIDRAGLAPGFQSKKIIPLNGCDG